MIPGEVIPEYKVQIEAYLTKLLNLSEPLVLDLKTRKNRTGDTTFAYYQKDLQAEKAGLMSFAMQSFSLVVDCSTPDKAGSFGIDVCLSYQHSELCGGGSNGVRTYLIGLVNDRWQEKNLQIVTRHQHQAMMNWIQKGQENKE